MFLENLHSVVYSCWWDSSLIHAQQIILSINQHETNDRKAEMSLGNGCHVLMNRFYFKQMKYSRLISKYMYFFFSHLHFDCSAWSRRQNVYTKRYQVFRTFVRDFRSGGIKYLQNLIHPIKISEWCPILISVVTWNYMYGIYTVCIRLSFCSRPYVMMQYGFNRIYQTTSPV